MFDDKELIMSIVYIIFYVVEEIFRVMRVRKKKFW